MFSRFPKYHCIFTEIILLPFQAYEDKRITTFIQFFKKHSNLTKLIEQIELTK